MREYPYEWLIDLDRKYKEPETWGWSSAEDYLEKFGRWVSYNTNNGTWEFTPGSVTYSYNPPKKAPEPELDLGDTQPLDDFLETFTAKE